MNIDLLYKQLDRVMENRGKFVEHLRKHSNPKVKAHAMAEDKNTEGIVRRALVNYLDEETNLTDLQKFAVETYLIEQYGFSLRANYGQNVTVTVHNQEELDDE